MLSDDLKQTIQKAYSRFLEARGLKPRYGQRLMIAEIAKTLGAIELDEEQRRQSQGHVCVIEAGTGTGKTVAYLLAAIPIARALGKKLVVSTATVALQEQIVNKDLPQLRDNSGLQFSFALAKGRGRYLCQTKLDLLLESDITANRTQPLYADEYPALGLEDIKLYKSMDEALAANRWDGDRDNWPQALDGDRWSRVTTDHRQCTGRRCSNVSVCAFLRARDKIDVVDCIVTNHDLVLADLALGGGAILPDPADTLYIFDEGHHLPEKALGHFSHHSRVVATAKWLEQCAKSLEPMRGQISGAGSVDHFLEKMPAVIEAAKYQAEQVYPLVEQLTQGKLGRGQLQRYRFVQGVVPEELLALAGELKQGFERLAELLKKIVDELGDAMEDGHCKVPKVDLETWYPLVGTWLARAEANLELWASYASRDNASSANIGGDKCASAANRSHNGAGLNDQAASSGAGSQTDREFGGTANDTAGEAPVLPKARWVTLVDLGSGGVDFEVCSSPILAARTLDYGLWRRCCGAVVTSATLTALGNFDRFQMRAGTPGDGRYQRVPSPFDYGAGLLRVPREACDGGNAPVHTQSLMAILPRILSPGEASLVLFSSRRQMLEVYDGLPPEWQGNILVQGERSKQEIIKAHRRRIDTGDGSVLFGLASFAEGLDLPGDYCRHVVVAKLPFTVPDDPVDAALAEWIEARGGNAFMEISVPDAALKLVQACGRLLRTESDSGVVSLLDRRIVTRRYGKAILDSLPPFKRELP